MEYNDINLDDNDINLDDNDINLDNNDINMDYNDIHLFKKIVSSVSIYNFNNVIDIYMYNNILYILHKYEDNLYLIYYDLNMYKIIYTCKFYNFVTGCFYKDKLYIMYKNSNICYYVMETKVYKYYTYERFEITGNINKKNYTLYYINDKLYLCYVDNLKFIIHDFINNLKYEQVVEYDDCNIFYQIKDDIYLNISNVSYNFKKLYMFNTETKNFTNKCYDNNNNNKIIKISKSKAYINYKIHDYENDIVLYNKKMNDFIYYNKFIYYDEFIDYIITVYGDNIKENVYFYDKLLLISTCGTISKINNNDDVKLTNGVDSICISKKVLIERSKFFKNMFNDCGDIKIDFLKFDNKYYNNLHIYIKYITTNIVKIEEFTDLFELCLFIEDIDIKHLANCIINNRIKFDVNIRYFKYLELFYTNGLMQEYYLLLNNIYDKNININDFIKNLKKTKTSSDYYKFYTDCLEYLVEYQYNYNNYNVIINPELVMEL